jgi:hypothetical protein
MPQQLNCRTKELSLLEKKGFSVGGFMPERELNNTTSASKQYQKHMAHSMTSITFRTLSITSTLSSIMPRENQLQDNNDSTYTSSPCARTFNNHDGVLQHCRTNFLHAEA